MSNKDLIVNRLKTIQEIEGVNVRVTKQKSTIYIKYPTEKSLDFKFIWQDDHFIGYFLDHEGNQSQAVISIWTPMNAIYFVTAYSLLIGLRAKRSSPY